MCLCEKERENEEENPEKSSLDHCLSPTWEIRASECFHLELLFTICLADSAFHPHFPAGSEKVFFFCCCLSAALLVTGSLRPPGGLCGHVLDRLLSISSSSVGQQHEEKHWGKKLSCSLFVFCVVPQ